MKPAPPSATDVARGALEEPLRLPSASAFGLVLPRGTAAVLVPSALVIAFFAIRLLGAWGWNGWSFVPLGAVIATVSWLHAQPTTLTFGPDAVRLRWVRWRRDVRYADVSAVAAVRRASWSEPRVQLRLRSGATLTFSTLFGGEASRPPMRWHVDAERVAGLFERARARSIAGDVEPVGGRGTSGNGREREGKGSPPDARGLTP